MSVNKIHILVSHIELNKLLKKDINHLDSEDIKIEQCWHIDLSKLYNESDFQIDKISYFFEQHRELIDITDAILYFFHSNEDIYNYVTSKAKTQYELHINELEEEFKSVTSFKSMFADVFTTDFKNINKNIK